MLWGAVSDVLLGSLGERMDGLHGNYQYKIVERIGQGGFGFVEKIELFNSDGVRCGDYAMKCLRGEFEEEQEEFKRRFAREVTYQASCVHTNVANIYLCDLKSPNPWFVMDLADGDLHKDLMSGRLSLADKVEAFDMVLQGVIHIHQHKYLHRDIKPNNVLRFGSIYKVSDFGLVKNQDTAAESEVLTKITTVMGTQRYRAPEVIAAAQYGVASDIYSLGILMEDMGFPEDAGVLRVLRKSTERRPLDRYTTAQAMRDDFIMASKEIVG